MPDNSAQAMYARTQLDVLRCLRSGMLQSCDLKSTSAISTVAPLLLSFRPFSPQSRLPDGRISETAAIDWVQKTVPRLGGIQGQNVEGYSWPRADTNPHSHCSTV